MARRPSVDCVESVTRATPGQPGTTAGPSKPTGDVRAVDLELAQRCRHGDAGAFEELYRAHAGRLYNLVFRMAGSADEAEDLLQEVFLHAHRKLGSFRGDSSLGTWLYRLAVNHCLDVLRGRQAKMTRVTDSLDEDGAGRAGGGGRPACRPPSAASTSSGRLPGCRRDAAPRSCCTTSKGSSTTKWRGCSASRKARRSRRCTRRA